MVAAVLALIQPFIQPPPQAFAPPFQEWSRAPMYWRSFFCSSAAPRTGKGSTVAPEPLGCAKTVPPVGSSTALRSPKPRTPRRVPK